MDKLKELLTTEEFSFSARNGAGLLGEFVKSHPLAKKVFDQPHADADYTKHLTKETINATYEITQPYAEQVYPVIADMFLEAEKLQEILKDTHASMSTWIGTRIIAASLSLMIHKAYKDVEEGKWADKIKIQAVNEDLNSEMIVYISKVAVTKLVSEMVGSYMNNILADFMDEIPTPKDFTSK